MSNNNQFLRQLLIIRKIQSDNSKSIFPSVNDLINYLKKEDIERSVLTIKRDFLSIRVDLMIDLEFDRKEKGYFISSKIEDNSVIQTALESFEILSSINRDGRMPEFIISEKRRSKGTEHFYLIMKAIEEKSKITFKYQKYDSDAKTEPIVEPHAIKESKGRWYLLGVAKGEYEIKAYALDRIIEIDEVAENFKKRIDRGIIEKKYDACFAMFTSNEPAQKVVLSFDKRDGNYINSYPIHHSQKTESKNDNVIVTLNIKITLDFIMELMSRAWSLEVIEPISLRNQLYEIFKNASERNKQNQQ